MVRLTRSVPNRSMKSIGAAVLSALVSFMTSGPALALVLERDEAVAHLRKVIGRRTPRRRTRARSGASTPVEGKECDSRVRFSGKCGPRSRVFLPARGSADAVDASATTV